MDSPQNTLEYLQDQMQQGKMTAAQANVQKVRLERVCLVTTPLPRAVRSALNAAVKRGELAHIAKDGRKPEAYYHPEFDFLMKSARRQHEESIVRALSSVMVRPIDILLDSLSDDSQ